jgi:uncharacterized protein YPO0396
VFDSFPPYGAWFRRRFGIDNEQALELFHQTVSMKSVGNLTDFVRSHMLEPFDVAPRIAALIAHFDDLNRAHEAVLKAKRQVALLDAAGGRRRPPCRAGRGQDDELRACRDAAQAPLRRPQARAARQAHQHLDEDGRASAMSSVLGPQREQLRAGGELRANIADNGGDRLERLALEIRRKDQELPGASAQGRNATDTAAPGPWARLTVPVTKADFLNQRRLVRAAALKPPPTASRAAERSPSTACCCARASRTRRAHAEISLSLKARRSNIPAEQVAMRAPCATRCSWRSIDALCRRAAAGARR